MFDDRILSNSLLPIFKPALHRAVQRVKAFTMISGNRMQNLHRLLRRLDRAGIRGDIVEAGAAKGGSAAFFMLISEGCNPPRRVYTYDAFELFGDEGAGVYEDVSRTLFDEFRFDPDRLKLVHGFFDDTLPAHPDDRPVALAHLDAGNYAAMAAAFEHVADRVVPGGYVAIDNYGVDEGAKQATDEWLAQHQPDHKVGPMERFGHSQVFMKVLKPLAVPPKVPA